MKFLVTGGAGFIGSHIVDILVKYGNEVVVYDNLSTGKLDFINHHKDKKSFSFIRADLLDSNKLNEAMKGVDFVYHMASNADIRHGTIDTRLDLEQNTLATYNVLEAMRIGNVKNIAFASSSVVYGEADVFPTPENYGPLIPISLYGASKLACEGLISAYSSIFGFRSWIFRFANIVGSRQTHGVLVDFIDKLRKNPLELEILGDGGQRKSYMLVEECVDALLYCVEQAKDVVNIFNLGSQDQISVSRIAEILIEELGLEKTVVKYTGGKRGWPGDVPKMMLSIKKLNNLGWKTRYTSEEAIKKASKVIANEIFRESHENYKK